MIDAIDSRHKEMALLTKTDTAERARKAYADYLRNSGSTARFRVDALSRFAELELNSARDDRQEQNAVADEAGTRAEISSVIELLSAALLTYPDAENNDILLYQLAKAYAQTGESEKSLAYLKRLVDEFPGSQFYAEAQFRIGEDAFSRGDYGGAEHAYTEVILSPKNGTFHEKALFKRGWSRFKQLYYREALEDGFEAISLHGFGSSQGLPASDAEVFSEYFRLLGLGFYYLGGVKAIRSYFADKAGYQYIYHVYASLGDVYFKQERFSDAVQVYQQFVAHHPHSSSVPYAFLEEIRTWQQSGFENKVHDAVERFFQAFGKDSEYWRGVDEHSEVGRRVRAGLKKYIAMMARHYHGKYQAAPTDGAFRDAETWYGRYFDAYAEDGRDEQMAFMFAELLAQHGDYERALGYYEVAAFREDTILHMESAYASVLLSEKLFSLHPEHKQYLRKMISYSLRYVRANPGDNHVRELTARVARTAYESGEFLSALELAEGFFAQPSNDHLLWEVVDVAAQSYFSLGRFEETERIYATKLEGEAPDAKLRTELVEKRALAVYRQGDAALSDNDRSGAVFHYSRISADMPDSKIAPAGLYEAIALEIQAKRWREAIALIQRFQRLYPEHEHGADIARKLSVAYLQTDQGQKAAQELERLSGMHADTQLRAAALWNAAEIYIDTREFESAIHAYEEYVRRFTKPFPQYMEALYQLVELHGEHGSKKAQAGWLGKIVAADRSAPDELRTERTKYLASMAYLRLGNRHQERFMKLDLTLPLKDSLQRKKSAMEEAVRLYGGASRYGVLDVVSEATYQTAAIYAAFSKALLDSVRPPDLSEEELAQYEVLLEEQAFQFEDKVIELHEINLARTRGGGFDRWIERSLNELKVIFPEKYDREPKQDAFIGKMY